MRILLAAPLILAALAGCASDSGGSDVTSDDFGDVKVDVDDETGVILGVVVDDALRTVEGATVVLKGTPEVTKKTDDKGRFVFDQVPPGIQVLSASAPYHKSTQSNVEVVAGVAAPPTTKILLERLYKQDPYTTFETRDGYFECSQAGLLIGIYSSSNCVVDPCPRVQDPKECNTYPTSELDNVTNQEREWHMDVGPGWQSIVYEMTWTPSAQGTSSNMGLVVSTYKPERDPAHSFANVASANPLRIQLDQNETHPTAGPIEPTKIPPEGMQRVSYFASVRQDNWPVPAVAYEQSFSVFITTWYYAKAPEDWSYVAGDARPF